MLQNAFTVKIRFQYFSVPGGKQSSTKPDRRLRVKSRINDKTSVPRYSNFCQSFENFHTNRVFV